MANAKFETSDTPTPYRIICPSHGPMFLTERAYNAQLMAGSQPWLCGCGASCEWDDLHHENWYAPEAPDA